MTETIDSASVALVKGGRVLLILRARPPYEGLWTLPGGRLQPGETAEAAATRELREELDLTVSALRPVTRMTIEAPPSGNSGPPRRFDLKVFATNTFAGHITASDEIADYRWIETGRMGDLPLTPNLEQVIAAALAVFDRG
jgi:ADP-ribose pyrophosphatase YjhB (NUDIX family)